MTVLTIPTDQIKAHVERIVSKHGLTLTTEAITDAPLSPFVGRHLVHGREGAKLIVGVAFRPDEEDEAIVEIWKVLVGWGIV